MKFMSKYNIVAITLLLLNGFYANAMRPELTKNNRYRIMDRVSAPNRSINLDNCARIKELQFYMHNQQIVMSALYIKARQPQNIDHLEGIWATWNCSNLTMLDSKEAMIVSRKSLQPLSDQNDEDDEPTSDQLRISNPAHDNQWIGTRDKDGKWAVYMEQPFTRICFLSKKREPNPELAVYSPDGNHIATAHGTTITLWNLVCKNRLMQTLKKPLKWHIEVLNQVLNKEFVKQQDQKWLWDQFSLYAETKYDDDKRLAKHQEPTSSSRFVRPHKSIRHYTDEAKSQLNAD